jgi:hypothetical protein
LIVKRAIFVRRTGGQHSTAWAVSFFEGLRRHGWQTDFVDRPEPATLLVEWSARYGPRMAAQKARGGEVCILERGYLGDRYAWTSVSFGGELNGRATFRGVEDDPCRFETHFADLMQPWRGEGGRVALLVGQVPGDMALRAVNGRLDEWYASTAAELRAAGYSVEFRRHPRDKTDTVVPGVETTRGTLGADMASAAAVVTFSSNTAVEAVLAGVPAIAADPGSMAYEVTSHAVAEPLIRPDREAWAARLAWKQWTREEMASGLCWERVGF